MTCHHSVILSVAGFSTWKSHQLVADTNEPVQSLFASKFKRTIKRNGLGLNLSVSGTFYIWH